MSIFGNFSCSNVLPLEEGRFYATVIAGDGRSASTLPQSTPEHTSEALIDLAIQIAATDDERIGLVERAARDYRDGTELTLAALIYGVPVASLMAHLGLL